MTARSETQSDNDKGTLVAIGLMLVSLMCLFAIFVSATTETFFSSGAIEAHDIVPFNDTAFAIVFCDETGNDLTMTVHDIDGTEYVSETDLDSNLGSCSYGTVRATALNDSNIAIAYLDGAVADLVTLIVDTDGNVVSGPTNVDTGMSTGLSTFWGVDAISETRYVIGWFNTNSNTYFASVFDENAENVTATETVDNSGAFQYEHMDIAVINSTRIAIVFNNQSSDTVLKIYDESLNQVGSDVPLTYAVVGELEIETLNDTHFVALYFDMDVEDVSFQILDVDGNTALGETDVDTDCDKVYGCVVHLAVINQTNFITTRIDYYFGDYDLKYYEFDTSGNSLGSDTLVVGGTSHTKYFDVGSQASNASGIGLQNDMFVISYCDTSNNDYGVFKVYNSDGSYYDIEEPTYSGNSTNSTQIASDTLFSLDWEDYGTLAGYIFSFDNCTGSFVNDSYAAMSGSSDTMEVEKWVNETVGCTIRWCVYANDTEGNMNGTSCSDPFQFVTTPSNVAPTVTDIVEPTDPSTYSYGQTLEFNITACDDNDATDLDTVMLDIQGVNRTITTYTEVNVSCREYYDDITSLEADAGGFTYTFYVNDSYGESVSDSGTFTLNKATPSLTLSCSGSTYPADPSCTASENNNGDGDLTYNFYIDDVLNTSGSSVSWSEDRGSGSYTGTYNTSGGTNYTSAETTDGFTVSKGSRTSDVLFNETSPIIYGAALNVSCSVDNGPSDGSWSLYKNGTDVTSNKDAGVAYEAGYFNFTCTISEGTNWSASSKEENFQVDRADPTSSMQLFLNGSQENFTAGYGYAYVNVSGYSVLSDNEDLTFNLYNSSGLMDTGDPANITLNLSIGEHQMIYNTSGGDNYTSGSLTYYVSVFNSTEGTPTQNTTLSVVAATTYNVTWVTEIDLVNAAGFQGNVSYNYTIPSAFTPVNVTVLNSSGDTVTSTTSGNSVNFTTENLTASGSATMAVYWTCEDCLSDSENLILYTSTEYHKNVTVTSTLSGYTTTASTIKIEVPNVFTATGFDFSLLRYDGASMTYSVTNDGNYYDYVTISGETFSSSHIYDLDITAKASGSGSTPDTGDTGGGGGGGGSTCGSEGSLCDDTGDCCGGFECSANKTCQYPTGLSILPSNITFGIYPQLIEPDPRFRQLTPGSTFQDVITIYNMESNPDIVIKPNWKFTCDPQSEEKCLADWCWLKAEDNNTDEAIPAFSSKNYVLTCEIPLYANTNMNCTGDPGCNIYSGAIAIWPDGYDTSTSQGILLTLPVIASDPFLSAITGGLASIDYTNTQKFLLGAWEFLTTPILCMSKSCYKEGLPFLDTMDVAFELGFIFFDGINMLHIIISIVVAVVMLIFKPWNT